MNTSIMLFIAGKTKAWGLRFTLSILLMLTGAVSMNADNHCKNCAASPLSDSSAAEFIGIRVVDQLTRHHDGILSDNVLPGLCQETNLVNLRYSPAHHYAEACAGFGAVELCAALNDNKRLAQLETYYATVLEKVPLAQTDHVDANVYGILPFELYKATNKEKWLKEGLRLADSQWASPNEDGLTDQARYWVDDMWMVSSLQVQAFKATRDKRYLNRAARLLALYGERLQQPDGLFYHAEKVPHFWGRGNGWVAAALAFTLKELPADHPDYSAISTAYNKMMDTLLTLQTENGMWRQLLDNPESWEESSCTAMFAYAMATGINHDLIPAKNKKTCRKAVLRAWSGLVSHMTEDGRLTEICVGTGKYDSVQYYLDRPRQTGDLHGQAPMLWLANELLEW